MPYLTITIIVIITGRPNNMSELFADDVCLEERGVRSDIPTDNSPNKQLGEKKCNLSVSVGAEG